MSLSVLIVDDSATVRAVIAKTLDLAGVPVAAFDPSELSRVLSLPEEEDPIYLVPVGTPEAP